MRICQELNKKKMMKKKWLLNWWSITLVIDLLFDWLTPPLNQKQTNNYFSFQSRIDAESKDLNELQIYLKKENTTQFYCNINTKAIAWDQIKKEKKIKQIFANAVKKKSQKKVTHNETHTIILLWKKSLAMCGLYLDHDLFNYWVRNSEMQP